MQRGFNLPEVSESEALRTSLKISVHTFLSEAAPKVTDFKRNVLYREYRLFERQEHKDILIIIIIIFVIIQSIHSAYPRMSR